MYKVGLYTLGCKVSLYETEAVAESFAERGFEVCDFNSVCDVYVINTCTVTAESDAKSRKYIRRAIRKNPSAVVIVMGCYSQRDPCAVAKIDGVSAVIGTQDKMKCVEIAEELLNSKFEIRNSKWSSSSNGVASNLDPNSTSLEGQGRGEHCSSESHPHPPQAVPLPLSWGRLCMGEHCSSGRPEKLISNSEFRIPNFVTPLEGATFEPMCVKNAPRTRAYVKIEDGCECRCTYCAISGARGPVRSKRPEDVIAEVEGLYSRGTLEVVLTGIETGSYGADFVEKYDLADLMCELDRRQSCARVRLGSMAPELMKADFVDRICDLKITVPHFHISMQSGADNVLRGMKRRYNREMALRNIRHIREVMPRVMLTADLMVGFPGESEEDFLDTMRFVSEARLLDAHVFAYSKRAGTPAAEYDGQIDERVKAERSARLIAECRRVQSDLLDSVVAFGEPLSVIFETGRGREYLGHSDSYIEVVAESDRDVKGMLLSVIPLRHENGKIYGKIV